jgi:hypothetical protein
LERPTRVLAALRRAHASAAPAAEPRLREAV